MRLFSSIGLWNWLSVYVFLHVYHGDMHTHNARLLFLLPTSRSHPRTSRLNRLTHRDYLSNDVVFSARNKTRSCIYQQNSTSITEFQCAHNTLEMCERTMACIYALHPCGWAVGSESGVSGRRRCNRALFICDPKRQSVY